MLFIASGGFMSSPLNTILQCPKSIVLAMSVGALTLAQAQHLAIERSRQLTAKDFAVAASREMAVAAAQLPDPVVKIGVDNLPVEGADRFSVARDFMTMRRVGVRQELTRADKRHWRADRFEREAEKFVAEKTAAGASIERDTALAWLDRYYAAARPTCRRPKRPGCV
jgi:hypothetical protein